MVIVLVFCIMVSKLQALVLVVTNSYAAMKLHTAETCHDRYRKVSIIVVSHVSIMRMRLGVVVL